MATRSNKEIRQLVNDLAQAFSDLAAKDKEWRDVETGDYDYRIHVPERLAVTPADRISWPHRGVSEIGAIIESTISWPFIPRVYMGSGVRAEADADSSELWFAHYIARTDPRKYHKHRITHAMTYLRYGVLVVGTNPHQPPEGKSDEYNETYWRWRWETPDPASVSFEQRDGLVTVAAIKEEIPYADLAKYFPEESGNPKDVVAAHFPALRLGDGSAIETGNEKLTRYVIFDDRHICTYIEQAGGEGANYEQVYEERHTFGATPVIIFPGTYRPWAPMAQRFAPLIEPGLHIQKQLSALDSTIMTVTGNPKLGTAPSDVILQQLTGMLASEALDVKQLQELIDAMKSNGTNLLLGAPSDITPQLQDSLREMREHWEGQWQEWVSRVTTVSPDPDTVQLATAAAVFMQEAAGQRRFSRPQDVLADGFTQACLLMANDLAYNKEMSWASGKTKTMGIETTRTYHSPGEEVEISPTLMAKFGEGKATLVMEPSAMTDAQRAAKTQLTIAARAEGAATLEDVLEAMGEQDVTGKIDQLREEQYAQFLDPAGKQAATQLFAQEMSAFMDIPPELAAELIGSTPQPMPQTDSEAPSTTSGATYGGAVTAMPPSRNGVS